MSAPISERPRPVRDAASDATRVFGVVGSLITAAAGFGILSAAEQNTLFGLLGAIPGLITLVTTMLVAFGVVRQSEPMVTPLEDPRDALMQPLLSAPPAPTFRR